jgi:rhomboid family GlyGly-CTERM serine protease
MRLTSAIGPPILLLFVLAAELLLLGDALEYRRPLLGSEPWRLLTGHFVHLSLLHAMLNGVALLLLARLFADRLRPSEFWTVLGVAPILISLVVWSALPELTWYRGLSGSLHALYFAGCITWISTAPPQDRWLPIAAIAGGAVKVLLEQPWDASFPFREWLGGAVVPQAHLVGAVIGAVVGWWFVWRRGARFRHGADG